MKGKERNERVELEMTSSAADFDLQKSRIPGPCR
jgi:hypothetical protein